ncbi:MAG: hypothetical protein ACRYFU_15935 [Janthinobacterium lividum]
MIPKRRLLSVAALLFPVALAGCHVETHKDGKNNNVDIGTPFGGLSVKTDEPATLSKLGLTPYPGATLVRKHNGEDGTADVNLSLGDFKLGVQAADLQTMDSQDKVLAFYRKDMRRYGAVLTCRGQDTVGQPTRTADGLTCNTNQDHPGGDEMQLRAGSESHQHIVGLHAEDGGTRIGLVALDLPFKLKSFNIKTHSGDDRE